MIEHVQFDFINEQKVVLHKNKENILVVEWGSTP